MRSRGRVIDKYERRGKPYMVTEYVTEDEHGTIEEANFAAADILATSCKALRGKPLAVYLEREHRSGFRNLLCRITPGQRIEAELAFHPPTAKSLRTALVTVSRDEEKPGEPTRLRWLLRDITVRRRAEEAGAKERWERYRSNIAAASAALQGENSGAARRASA